MDCKIEEGDPFNKFTKNEDSEEKTKPRGDLSRSERMLVTLIIINVIILLVHIEGAKKGPPKTATIYLYLMQLCRMKTAPVLNNYY